jgi:bifunctional non-homologous end joining protein LigD
MSASAEVEIGGRTLKLSNLDKVFYPRAGFTKAQVIDYYARIAPFVLPHLADRPLTLKRYPDGVEGPFFYEKRCPRHAPGWVKTAPVWSEGNQEDVNFCLANDLPTLIWAANLADLELHTSLALARDIQRPTALVFDLDPGEPADLLDCCQVGLWIRAALDSFGLQSFAKTSGSKGLQLYVPLNTPLTYEETKPFAHELARRLEREHPDRVVSKMLKKLRVGKVLVDWSQNDPRKTTVCVYSLRARERPTVSTPVSWPEVETALRRGDKARLTFDAEQVLARVDRLGDLFEPLLTLKQTLPSL